MLELPIWKYIGAFAVGFLTPIVGIMLTGHWPQGAIWPVAIATGLSNTGFLKMRPPTSKNS